MPSGWKPSGRGMVSGRLRCCGCRAAGAAGGGERRAGTTAATGASATGPLPPTPACDDGDDPTPAETEGPFFTPSSPERGSLLAPGLGGTRLTLAGVVASTSCRPV